MADILVRLVKNESPEEELTSWNAPCVPRVGDALLHNGIRYVVLYVRWEVRAAVSARVFVGEIRPITDPSTSPEKSDS
jgi:hypothetical protein